MPDLPDQYGGPSFEHVRSEKCAWVLEGSDTIGTLLLYDIPPIWQMICHASGVTG